jgi:hypothetical protein
VTPDNMPHATWEKSAKALVGSCAKKYPKQFAAFHLLFDAATRVVNQAVVPQN